MIFEIDDMSPSMEENEIREGGWTYDVFLSFRGEDTRYLFVSHLHAALSGAGIRTFIDDKLRRGSQISTSLMQAIEWSRHSIVVFSENYANSAWCLDELVKIMECHTDKNIGQIFVPIFQFVKPSDVRYQSGKFGQRFETLIKQMSFESTRIEGWRAALTQAASLSGWTLDIGMSESKMIKDIVKDISEKLDSNNLFVADYPVGIGPRVQKIISELKKSARSEDVLIVGLWGMGGIGKTTIAKAIFNALRKQFHKRSFIANIREAWEHSKGQQLQEQLISDILEETTLKVTSIDRGKDIMKERLRNIRALVLDDVKDEDQLKALGGNRNCFSPSSIIIITTRNVDLLVKLEADYVHEMKEMDYDESLELFSWHAFRLPFSPIEFTELSRNVVLYCGGLPLALEVLGSYLCKRPKTLWEDVLSKLKKIPNEKIQEKLKISYDGLNDAMNKDIFLDICCFFIGKNRDYVTVILEGCGLNARIGITVLIEQSLVKVDRNNKLVMHDLLRDMGREVIRQKSPENLGERSRLWFHEDALDVLRGNMGTSIVTGFAMRLPRTNKICLPTKAFSGMKDLRLLQLSHLQLVGSYDNLLEKLRWICWPEFPSTYAPQNFYKESLVAIDLRHSNLELFWKVPQHLHQLKILNLSHSHYLMESPDFSYMPNLEKLILKDCPSLSRVGKAIGNLNKLHLVNLKDCKSLGYLPRSIYGLTSLETLVLSGCSKIVELEGDIEQMESLTSLVADKTAITKVPYSILRLKKIGYISLCGYAGLPSDVFPSIIWSWQSPSNNPRSLCQAFCSISSRISFEVQYSVYLRNGSELDTIPSTSQISDKEASDSTVVLHNQVGNLKLENFTSSLTIKIGRCSIFQGWTTDGSGGYSFLGDEYPNWPSYSNDGRCVFFQVPRFFGCNLEGMILRIDYSSSQNNKASPFPIGVSVHNNTRNHSVLQARCRNHNSW